MVRIQLRKRDPIRTLPPHDGNTHRIRALFHRPAGSGRPAPGAPGAGRRRGSHLHRSRPHRHDPRPPRPRLGPRRRARRRHAGRAETGLTARVCPGGARHRRPASGPMRETGSRPDALRPGRSDGKMFFNSLDAFSEFGADLIRTRSREGMAIARARGKFRGKQPKLSNRQPAGTLPHPCHPRVFHQRSRRAILRLITNHQSNTHYRTLTRCHSH